MPGDDDQPARLGLDADQGVDQHPGRFRLESGTGAAEQRQAVQAHGSRRACRHRARRRLPVVGDGRQQPCAQLLAAIQAKAQRQGLAPAVVMVEAHRVLAQHVQRFFPLGKFGLIATLRRGNGRITPQVIADLTQQQGVLPGRAGQGDNGGCREQPQRNYAGATYW
ncbi:hypothetical protein D3C81_1177130 [compost metagenome]